ncbi:MAG: hypothetical protein E6H52_04745 [Betaproteobacteria bacterium]|nr:MAG: hypothetical protein E6H52_04745 [Betaproteobacteria bacterium]
MAAIPITARGAEMLKAELNRLKAVERPTVIQAIKDARALIGKSEGDVAEVAAPAGPREYEVLDVRYV